MAGRAGRGEELIGATEVARLLRLSPQRIPQLAQEGKLPFQWVAGRRVYKRADVVALKKARGPRRRKG